jgi:hypothetical protein
MSVKTFPRKELYVHHTKKPLESSLVKALNDVKFKINPALELYSDYRWDLENKGWISSPIPTITDLDSSKNELIIHCGISEYKYLLGMVKLAEYKKESDTHGIVHGLSTEIIPIFSDDTLIFEQRNPKSTQHGAGFYDIPTASQNAQIYIEKANKIKEGLVKNIFDMDGFPRYHIIKAFPKIPIEEIKEIFYTGFSRGFEVSLDTQINGYTKIDVDGAELIRGENYDNRLIYNLSDLLYILDSIGESTTKEDVYSRNPRENTQTGKFAIIDDCIGNLLSYLYHKKYNDYNSAIEILEKKGYKINEVNKNRIDLNTLI